MKKISTDKTGSPREIPLLAGIPGHADQIPIGPFTTDADVRPWLDAQETE